MTTKHYRIRFWPTAQIRMDPLEFAWMLAKHYVEVVGLVEPGTLLVKCACRDMLDDFTRDVNDIYGPLIFESVEALGDGGYEEI